MPTKHVLFRSEAREKILRGATTLTDAVRVTLGPKSKCVLKAQVAAISAHNDPGIGELVADAFEKVGRGGVVWVEEAKGTETALEVVEGMQFDRGYLSPYFVTDPEKMEAVLDEPLILLMERKLTTLKGLVPLLEELAKLGRPLLVVAEDVEREALATLVVTCLRSGTARPESTGFAESPAGPWRRRVLIATGDDRLRSSGRDLLAEQGYLVVTATGGVGCVALLRGLVPDVVVLDTDLLWGGADGVLAHLRAADDTRVPVVLLASPFGEPPWRAGRLVPPVVSVLEKPVWAGALLSAVRSAAAEVP